jgi:hypothetical protein
MFSDEVVEGGWYDSKTTGCFPYKALIMHMQNDVVYFKLHAGDTPTDKCKCTTDEFKSFFERRDNSVNEYKLSQKDLADFAPFSKNLVV